MPHRTPSTISEAPLSLLDAPTRLATSPALVLVWSREEPHRMGEVLLVPTESPGKIWRFGRGGDLESPEVLSLYRQRPGVLERTPGLISPRISRTQLELTLSPVEAPGSGYALTLQNVGRCPLILTRPGEAPQTLDQATLQVGDVIELKNELMLLCVQRPSFLAPLPDSVKWPDFPFGHADLTGMVGESPLLWDLRRQVALLAPQPHHVLILGASGTGKELVARALHARSPRRTKEMLARNAATFPEGLIDAELFGNMRNYPNAGMPERPGLVGQANGSSLFLDEFAELPESLQSHLLRVMDEGEYQRLGESSVRHSQFRLMGATNRPESHIKHDILARLKLRVRVPDLNARREDIPLLVRHMLQRMARQDNTIAKRFFRLENPELEPRLTPELTRRLVTHGYRTHVRELEGLLLTALMESSGRFIDAGEALNRELDSRAQLSRGGSLESTDLLTSPLLPGAAVATSAASSSAMATSAASSSAGASSAVTTSTLATPVAIGSSTPRPGHSPTLTPGPALPPRAFPPEGSMPEAGMLKGDNQSPQDSTPFSWKMQLRQSLDRLLEAQSDEEPSYDSLHDIAEALKSEYVARLHAQSGEKLLTTARLLGCNRDVVRRLLERNSR